MKLRMKRRRRKQLLSSVIIFSYFFTENKKEASLSINRIQAPASIAPKSQRCVFFFSNEIEASETCRRLRLFMMKTGPAETCKCWPELFRTKTIFERKKRVSRRRRVFRNFLFDEFRVLALLFFSS